MAGKKVTEFQRIANAKGWKFDEIAKRWELSERQLSRIADAPKQRDLDALLGLPEYKERKVFMSTSFSNETLNEIEDFTFEKLKAAHGVCSKGSVSDTGSTNKAGVVLLSKDGDGNDIVITIEVRPKKL